jgi:hypothetical protein
MRETQKVKRFWLTFSSPFPVLFGKSPEFDPARFVWVQLQSEHSQTFPQILQEAICICPVLESHDGVSRPGESHPEALAELYVSLSTHTAPTMEPRRTPICQ